MHTHAREYVLVTPVRNEERTIGTTIRCVVGQTICPLEWVIVNDGSGDATAEIVANAALQHPWIRLITLPQRHKPDFSAVVRNTETGIRNLLSRDYCYLGLLDADLAFSETYFEHVIRRFEADPHLGLGGGVVLDPGTPKNRLPKNRADVPGAVQFYRRTCFEAMGGLYAVPEGGWDALACTVARMKGYHTQLFTELFVDHLKPRNISQGGPLRRKWQLGERDYALGYHPLFESVKCIGRASERPYLLAAIAWWSGYCWATIRRRQRMIPSQVVAHIRREQRDRLWALATARPSALSAT